MKTDIRNNVGLRIKELRRKGGITQEKFALMTGIKPKLSGRSSSRETETSGFDTLEQDREVFQAYQVSEFFDDI